MRASNFARDCHSASAPDEAAHIRANIRDEGKAAKRAAKNAEWEESQAILKQLEAVTL